MKVVTTVFLLFLFGYLECAIYSNAEINAFRANEAFEALHSGCIVQVNGAERACILAKVRSVEHKMLNIESCENLDMTYVDSFNKFGRISIP